MKSAQTKTTPAAPWLWLLFLTAIAILIEGYHLGVDDAEIYIAAIKRVTNPQLYPFGEQYFLTHAKLSFFAPLTGYSAQLLHLPVDLDLFLWHIATIFLFLLAGWRIACLCFANHHARWAAVTLLACTLAVPATGTALILMDPYVTARSLSTPATMLAIAYFIEKRMLLAVFWMLLTTLVHPQMVVYGLGFLLFFFLSDRLFSSKRANIEKPLAAAIWMQSRVPKGFHFQPAQGAYRETLYMRTFFFVSQWHWYEWLGVFAPLAILFGLSRISWRSTLPAFQKICRTLVLFGLCATGIALLLSSTSLLENFVRLQPMRCFHLIYIFFFLLIGGLIGEYFLQKKTLRWVALFLPLALGMTFLEYSMYPASRHIEWPGQPESNPWAAAFYWIRMNTPSDAVFAMDPKYMELPGEDQHGFRAIAERSRLADYYKDSGVASLFPAIAENWKEQQLATQGWSSFTAEDFKRLSREYPVRWLVLQRPAPTGLECPYNNLSIAVCKIPQ
jgi:hypothetical protein